jgi:hypothetical protein
MAKATYFAAREGKETAAILLEKATDWRNTLATNGYLEKLKTCWAAYHGAYYTDTASGHTITFAGEQGELAQLPVNHIRNLAQHMYVMTTSSRPSMEARAANTDYKSSAQVTLANGLLDYYLREKRLERFINRAVEFSIVLGAGYVKIEWDSTTGKVVEEDEESGEKVYEGDIKFTNLSPFDVVFDVNKEDNNHDWILVRTYKNKFDLAAKYPEFEDKILALDTKSQKDRYSLQVFRKIESDEVEVWTMYHRKSDAIPAGRELVFLSEDVVIHDQGLPYRRIPVFRMSPNVILGTDFGYSNLFDLLPLQEGINHLYSSIMSNNIAFATQNLFVRSGANIDITNLGGGLNIIQGSEKPEPLNLLGTSQETFNFLSILEGKMEQLSGVNSVTRGTPDPAANLRSGNSLALVQSMAIQFQSGLQNQYVQLVEDLGVAILEILQDYAMAPRVASIVGINNKQYLVAFKGSDIADINRVIVDVGNPLARCLEKGTEVLMFDGSKKKVEDIRVGELVMGPDSKPRTVSNINSGKEKMYKVISKDKNRKVTYGANESHILTLKYCSDDYRYDAKKGDILDITIRDYLKLPKRQRRLLQGFKVGVEFESKPMIIPPYILGSWIGDGTKSTAAITTMDDEIVKEWENCAACLGLSLRKSTSKNSGKANTYFITSGLQNGSNDRNVFLSELRALEVFNNKHIPRYYLTASRTQRLELLAGLLDTDGSLVNETFVFTQKDNRTAQDVVFLAESLGFRTTIKKVKNNSSKLVGEVFGEINKISIGGNTWEIPTRLLRKQSKQKEKARDWLNYGISVIESTEDTYYGFTLAEEPHFVLGDFTVTHNTTAGRVQMAEQLMQMKPEEFSIQQYAQVINTGRIDGMMESPIDQSNLIQQENERLIQGTPVPALVIDDHKEHILRHRTVLNDIDIRMDDQRSAAIYAHIQEHIEFARSTDPAVLTMTNQQQLPPAPAPAPPAQASTNNPNQNSEGQSPIGQVMEGSAQTQGQMMPGTPAPATPPAPFQDLPTTTVPSEPTEG